MNYTYINRKLEEFNAYISNKKIAIIGIGVSNIPLLDYFYKNNAKVTIFDKKTLDKLDDKVIEKISKYNIDYSLGENYLSKLIGFDVIFRSPSCRPDTKELVEEAKRGALITSEIEMLIKLCPGKVIGITGSDGKTTTTSLTYAILKEKGYDCYLGGNIGIPLFTKLNEMTPESIVVLELSSFQLMNMEISPNISVITNISPNHLDIHKSYEEYIECKKNIFTHQSSDGIVVLNADNEITNKMKSEANGKVIMFSSKQRLDNGVIYDNKTIKSCEDGLRRHVIDVKNVKLRGIHNYENICAAIAATSSLVDIDTQIKAITKFSGVEHRLEFIREINGVKWYNDSIGTSPSRTIAGLNSFDEKIVLIAGGYDKHLDYTPIAKPIVENVSALVLVGATTEKIYEAVTKELKTQNKDMPIVKCTTLEETISIANKIAKPGEVVLFSPASASFDMFKNFMERGDLFKELVNNI
ncbi:MAG: UDP-N-acetylmuramoyl-L-alanine--D-glutamate ligase [Clostridia bacterium]|nr:UDP-N-acetylmuramoyl-L-alanine--D-glutamate ligase [Clostridia bacterium]